MTAKARPKAKPKKPRRKPGPEAERLVIRDPEKALKALLKPRRK